VYYLIPQTCFNFQCTQQQTGNKPQTNGYLLAALISLCAVQTVLMAVLMIMNCMKAKQGVLSKEKTPVPQETLMRCEDNEFQCENDMYGKI
jgi:hypothetical protein